MIKHENFYQPKQIYYLHIDVVHGCQLQCVGCPNSTIQDKVEAIDVSNFNKILMNIDVEEIHTLHLYNFGEALLHKRLDEVVAQIPKQKWKFSTVELSTNAQYVDWDVFERMLKLNIVNRIAVSCDGDGSKNEYEKYRYPAQMDKLLVFLEKTAKLVKKHSPTTELITRTIINNEGDKITWDRLLKPLGWQPQYRGWMLLPFAKENVSKRPLEIVDNSCFYIADAKEFKNHPWSKEINLLYVDIDGTVVPCSCHPKASNFGNLLHDKYSKILNSPARKIFKSTMKTNRKNMEICSNCEMGPVGKEGASFYIAKQS